MKKINILFLIYCLLFFPCISASQPLKTITNFSKLSPNICFDNISNDVKQLILQKILNLYGIPIKIVTISEESVPICFLIMNQYQSTKFCNKIFSMRDMVTATPRDREIMRKGSDPSFIDRLSGVPRDAISEKSYSEIKKLSAPIKKDISVKIQSNDLQAWRLGEATTCICGATLCCCEHCVLGPSLYLSIGSLWCFLIGSAVCCLDATILCCQSSCCKKYTNKGFRPRRKTFS